MRFTLVWAIGLTVVLISLSATADDAEEIKKLIPAASGMARADFEKLAKSDAPKSSDVEEKTFTLLLFSAKMRDNEKAKLQFRFLTPGYPKPSQLAAEIYRSKGAKAEPVTMIHSDRISKITCDVKGDTANGVVTFEVPKLYAGEVAYVAHKVDETWRIEELAMSAYEIHVVREKGKWKKK